MTARRPLIPAALAAAAALAPATASAQQPTLQWDRACYTDDQRMSFTGTGFTPGGEVGIAFAHLGSPFGTYPARADAAGAVADYVLATSDQMLDSDEERQNVVATATDGTVPERSVGSKFTFTRWMGFSPGRYVPGRRAKVEIYGWAFAEGRTAYFLFRQGRRTVASVKAGTIEGPCGDLVARVKVPRRLRAGAYKVWLSTSRRGPSSRSTWRRARVVRKPSASASARPRPMRRG